MKISGQVFIGKKFVPGILEYEEKFLSFTPDDTAFDNRYIVPGFVDIHTHGGVGEDFSDGKPEAIQKLMHYYVTKGVTSVLGTTMTISEEEVSKACAAMANHVYNGGAKLQGIHLEGPFISEAKKGAQAASNIRKPDPALFHRLQEIAQGKIKMITYAPEEDADFLFTKEISRECVLSIGHTSTDYDTAVTALQNGASHCTHLFNAMPPLHHRSPGPIGAAMDENASVELICDGIHIHPSAIRLVHRLFGDRLNLISDSLRSAGMPDGDYTLGGQPIVLRNGIATLLDGTLAGSSIGLIDAVRNVVRFGLSLEDSIYAASTAPADAAKLYDCGRIREGCPADFVVLDTELQMEGVYVNGQSVL